MTDFYTSFNDYDLRSVACSQNGEYVVMVASYASTLWPSKGCILISSNHGDSWTKNEIYQYDYFGSAYSSNSGMIMAVGSRFGNILMSYDYGSTWDGKVTDSLNFGIFDIKGSSNGDILVAAQYLLKTSISGEQVYSGFLVSTDSGMTWANTYSCSPNSCLKVASDDAGRVFVGSIDHRGTTSQTSFVISKDSGDTWLSLAQAPSLMYGGSVLSIRRVGSDISQNMIVLAGYNGGLHVSNDCGDSFVLVTSAAGSSSLNYKFDMLAASTSDSYSHAFLAYGTHGDHERVISSDTTDYMKWQLAAADSFVSGKRITSFACDNNCAHEYFVYSNDPGTAVQKSGLIRVFDESSSSGGLSETQFTIIVSVVPIVVFIIASILYRWYRYRANSLAAVTNDPNSSTTLAMQPINHDYNQSVSSNRSVYPQPLMTHQQDPSASAYPSASTSYQQAPIFQMAESQPEFFSPQGQVQSSYPTSNTYNIPPSNVQYLGHPSYPTPQSYSQVPSYGNGLSSSGTYPANQTTY